MLIKISRIIVIAALVFGSSVSLSAANTQTAQAATPGATITYNIFATDAFVRLADGTVIYNYGFVGGRQGIPFTFQSSYKPDGQGNLSGGENVTLSGGPPSPTGGPVTEDEAVLQGNASFPGPLIYASVGDVVEIHFKNLGVMANPSSPNDPHSIHLHALDVNAANDGVPETSVGATPANLCDNGANDPNPLVNQCQGIPSPTAGGPDSTGFNPGAGNVIVYMFAPKVAGTYFYHCHQEADIHVQMGMYGALVIYNASDAAAATGPGSGKGGKLFGWKYDKDYVLLETEVDVRQHCSEQGIYNANGLCPDTVDNTVILPTLPGQVAGWDPVDYSPQYWLLNGNSFPNTVHAALPLTGFNWDNWIAAHPGYDPFIQGSVSAKSSDGTKGEKVLVRMINMGFETQPMHMHGFHAKVLGSDQRAWTWANNPGETVWGKGEEKNTITIGSGEEYDLLMNFGLLSVRSDYPAATQTRYFDSTIQACVDQTSGLTPAPVDGDPVSNTFTDCPAIISPDGSPYIGGPQVSGLESLPETVGVLNQIFPFHNHDDYKATNNGVYPGGMFTAIMPLP